MVDDPDSDGSSTDDEDSTLASPPAGPSEGGPRSEPGTREGEDLENTAPRGHVSDRYPERSHFAIRGELGGGARFGDFEGSAIIPAVALHAALGADTAAGGYYGAATLRIGFHPVFDSTAELMVGVDASWPIGDIVAIGLRPSAGLLGLHSPQDILLVGGGGVVLELQGVQTKVFGLGATLELRADYAETVGFFPGAFLAIQTHFRVPRRDDAP